MEKFNEIKGLLFNGVIGLLVGWGGFTQLFPNILEMLGDVAELGSYGALRIFSIVFFLFIIFLITSYWWIWGIDNYLESCSLSNYKVSVYVILLGLKLLPIIGFIINSFFVHIFSFFEFIIWYYLLVAIIELLLISWFFYPESGTKLLKVNTVIFSLDVVLGIGVVSFIEPWANYKTDFIYEAVGVGVIYVIVGFIFFYRIKENKDENDYRDLIIGFLMIIFLLGIFPSVNYNYWVGVGGVIIVLIGGVTIGILRFESFAKNKPALVNLIMIGGVLMILLGFHGTLMEHSNKNYFEERKKASKLISKIKINPLAALKKIRTGYGKSGVLDQCDIEPLNELVKGNHKWAYVSKGLLKKGNYTDSLFSEGETIDIQSWLEIKADYNVRTFFFKNYDTTIVSENQDSINAFYDSNYKYIHTEIIDNTLKPIRENEELFTAKEFKSLETYYHPINYYSETLDFYKERLNKMDRVLALSDFIIRIDSLYNHAKGTQGTSSWDYRVLRKEKTDEVDSLLSDIYEFENIYINIDTVEIKKTVEILELFSRHKNIEYKKRYHKAQIIFQVYLKDSQRVGVYVLLYVLVMALLFLWFWYQDKENANLNSDTSLGFAIVWFLSVLVTLVYIARPIEAENINPEKPHWMMNLDNWYSHTDFAVSSWGKEEKEQIKPSTVIVKYDNEKLTGALDLINETLKKIDVTIKEINVIDTGMLNKTHQNIDSINQNIKTLDKRFDNHGDFPDKKQEVQKK
jgi:hypothetical protein